MGIWDSAKKRIDDLKIGEETIRVIETDDEQEDAENEDTNDFFDAPREFEENVFDTSHSEEFYNELKRKGEEFQKEYDNVPDLSVKDSKVQDVLEVLSIEPTFTIPQDLFMTDDDIEEQSNFDLQAPYGFEQGEVKAFVKITKETVKKYMQLLKLRNEHVAKLASVIDKLQVDNNNLKYQNEISEGVNIMPTSEVVELENKFYEAKLQIKKLERKLADNSGVGLSSPERERYEKLQDTLAVIRRENEELKEENNDLKKEIASRMEDEYDIAPESEKDSDFPDLGF